MPRHRRPTRHRVALGAALVGAVLVVVSCGPTASQEVRTDAAPVPADGRAAREAVRSLNAFAIDVERAVSARGGNVVVASYPLAVSLALARAGALGTTQEEIDRLLHVEPGHDLDAGIATLARQLADHSGDRRSDDRQGRVSLTLSAALWTQEETSFPDSFLDRLSAAYDTGVRVVDFRSDPEAARDAMNRWVAAETDDRISQLVTRGTIKQFTRFVLTSTAYLQAPWATRFDPALTRSTEFRRLDSTSVAAPTMRARERRSFSLAEGDGWNAVELPYLGEQLAMLVIVPRAGAFDDFTRRLDDDILLSITRALRPAAVDLHLPAFQFTTELNLNQTLVALGLPSAFDPHRADFSGITTDEVLTISEVLSQTFAGVDEEGSDGEAATVIRRTPPTAFTPDPFRVDRPFLFVVRDTETGLVLQIGRVLDPTQ
jgi:serpin B